MTKANQDLRLKMAVIRRVRPPEALFYDAFQKMDVKFIFATQNPLSYPVQTKNLQLVNLRFKPKWFFDPISIINRGIYTNHSWVEIEGLEEELRDVDVVNISSIFYVWSGQEAKLAKKLGKKLVSIIWQNIPYHLSTFIPPYSFSVREVVKHTDLFILRSKRALRFTDSLGIPREKVKVIYKGVDTKMFHPPSRKVSTSAKASADKSEGQARPDARNLVSNTLINILYVGQLVESKGIDELLSAFARLSEELEGVKLTIAGEGPLEGMVRKFSQNYPIDYRGFVKYENLPEIYREADIFCMPSRDHKYLGLIKGYEEMFGYVLAEAQASGLPIVTTHCGAIPEMVSADNFLLEQGNAEVLYQALKRLAEDKTLREKLGSSNRKRAEKLFDLTKQAEETQEAILSLL